MAGLARVAMAMGHGDRVLCCCELILNDLPKTRKMVTL